MFHVNMRSFIPTQPGQAELILKKQKDPAPAPKAGSCEVAMPPEGVDPKAGGVVLEEFQNHHDVETSGPFCEVDFVTLHGISKKPKEYVPPSFSERPVFCMLAEKGLASIPAAQGFMLSHHSQSCQWHARCAHTNRNYAPTWGAKRTEEHALLLTLQRLWSWYVEQFPEDNDGRTYLERIRKYMDTVSCDAD